jgi:hypothetical protein
MACKFSASLLSKPFRGSALSGISHPYPSARDATARHAATAVAILHIGIFWAVRMSALAVCFAGVAMPAFGGAVLIVFIHRSEEKVVWVYA